MEETLFGVERGHLLGVEMSWAQDSDGTMQLLSFRFKWQNRRPSEVHLSLPDDQQISHYVALFMDVIMNGPWMHKVRLSHAIRGAIERASNDGAEIVERGTSLKRL